MNEKIKKNTVRLSSKRKLIHCIKDPANIFMLFVLLPVTIVGVVDENLDIIIIVYIGAILYGFIVRVFIFLINKIKNTIKF